jgi:hypothetical protein
VAFPLQLDMFEFCSEDLQKSLKVHSHFGLHRTSQRVFFSFIMLALHRFIAMPRSKSRRRR